MSGLLRPSNDRITYPFGALGLAAEPAGWLQTDSHGPLRYRNTAFAGSVYERHVHKGTDIGTPLGTHLLAPERGIVRGHGHDSNGSLYIVIEIQPGTVTMMGHLQSFVAPVGATVNRGQVVAISGDSGGVAPHCHWELRHTYSTNTYWVNWFSWYAYNAIRFSVGGDYAAVGWIKPVLHP